MKNESKLFLDASSPLILDKQTNKQPAKQLLARKMEYTKQLQAKPQNEGCLQKKPCILNYASEAQCV